MKMFFVILAAGKSIRFNSKIPKQFNFYKGKMVLEHSVDIAIKSKLFKKVISKYYIRLLYKCLIFVSLIKNRINLTFNSIILYYFTVYKV